MSIIDNTYFNEDITLTSGQLTNITDWITVYETEFLKMLLGYPLYKLLIADQDGNGDQQTEPYVSLVDGADFSFEYAGNTITERWEGLKGVNQKSVIAFYVFYQYMNQNETFNTTAGQKRNNSENSVSVSPVFKLVDVWNKMVELYGPVPDYRSEFFLNNDNYVHYNALPSAYNYLLANITDFETWVFKPLQKTNIFGI
jgi:hypothetical protein